MKIVKCIDTHGTTDKELVKGAIYEVVEESHHRYSLKGVKQKWWYADRFEIVKDDGVPVPTTSQDAPASAPIPDIPEEPFDFDSYNRIKRR